jgi:hypothetical protein
MSNCVICLDSLDSSVLIIRSRASGCVTPYWKFIGMKWLSGVHFGHWSLELLNPVTAISPKVGKSIYAICIKGCASVHDWSRQLGLKLPDPQMTVSPLVWQPNSSSIRRTCKDAWFIMMTQRMVAPAAISCQTIKQVSTTWCHADEWVAKAILVSNHPWTKKWANFCGHWNSNADWTHPLHVNFSIT